VEPTLNADPLAGVQDTVTGVVPPATVAEPYVTTADWPLLEVTGNGAAGHVMVGAGMMMVCEGNVGLLHPAASVAPPARAIAMATRLTDGEFLNAAPPVAPR
jgi:hypothetical protein